MKEKLNKFTTYKYLFETLKCGLFFSDGKNWPDKNDSELLEIYKKHFGKDVRVACLMGEDETIYHWQAFANGSCAQEVCCIEFDKDKLLELYEKSDGYISNPVDYKSIEDVVFDNPNKLLFTKRLPYRNEKECRIVYVGDKNQPLPELDMERFRKTITKITLSGGLSSEEYRQRKDYLMNKYSFQDGQINKSTVERNPFWINKAELQSKCLDYNNVENTVINEGDCLKKSSIESTYLLSLQKMISSETKTSSTTVFVSSENYVIAMGAVIEIDNNRMNELKGWSHFEQNELNYELCHFVVRDDYHGKDLFGIILKEVLAYYGDESLFADLQNADEEFKGALSKANFKMEDRFAFFDKKDSEKTTNKKNQ